MAAEPNLFIIAGPTASGKTDYAIAWALKHSAEIVSCDSLAIYRGMDIGTAKPSPEQRKIVPHWGIDLVWPNEKFSVYDYQNYAYKKVLDILGRGNRVCIVGGSGFYLKSFFGPVVDDLPGIENACSQVKQWSNLYGYEYLLKKLLVLHNDKLPVWFDAQNPARVQNALARCLASGLKLQELRERFESLSYPFKDFSKKTVLIARALEILKCRAQTRATTMINQGLSTEVKKLMNENLLLPNTPAAQSIGYRETIKFLQNPTDATLPQLEKEILTNTLSLIKKQLTWFRHQIHFHHRVHL